MNKAMTDEEKQAALVNLFKEKAAERGVNHEDLMKEYVAFVANAKAQLAPQAQKLDAKEVVSVQILPPIYVGKFTYSEEEIDSDLLDTDPEYVINPQSNYASFAKEVSNKLDRVVGMCCRISYGYGSTMSRLNVTKDKEGKDITPETYKMACDADLNRITASLEKLVLSMSQTYSLMHGARGAYERMTNMKIKNLIKFTYLMFKSIFVNIEDDKKKWGARMTRAPKHDIICKKIDPASVENIKMWHSAFQMAVEVVAIGYQLNIWLKTLAKVPGMEKDVKEYRDKFFTPVMEPFLNKGKDEMELINPILIVVINMSNDIIASMFTRKVMPPEEDTAFMEILKEEFAMYNDRRAAEDLARALQQQATISSEQTNKK